MSKLLYIEASPLESRSHTVAVLQAFLMLTGLRISAMRSSNWICGK